jgi:hypothetical protein
MNDPMRNTVGPYIVRSVDELHARERDEQDDEVRGLLGMKEHDGPERERKRRAHRRDGQARLEDVGRTREVVDEQIDDHRRDEDGIGDGVWRHVVHPEVVYRQQQETDEAAQHHRAPVGGHRADTQRNEDEIGDDVGEHDEQECARNRRAGDAADEQRRGVKPRIEQPERTQRAVEEVPHPAEMCQPVAGAVVEVAPQQRQARDRDDGTAAEGESGEADVALRCVQRDEHRNQECNPDTEPEAGRRRGVDVDLVAGCGSAVGEQHAAGEGEIADDEREFLCAVVRCGRRERTHRINHASRRLAAYSHSRRAIINVYRSRPL